MANPEGQLHKSKSVFKEWLEKLQQESWQLELLISGLALFGIWESRSMIMKFDYYLDTNIIQAYNFYARAFIFVLWSGWAIFLVNLLIHIIVRGLWIGAIGLRYVSGDVDYDELNYSEVFKGYFKKRIGSFDDYIERLEKLSSVLFSFTFLLFFLFFSFVFINIVFIVILSILDKVFYPDQAGPNSLVLIFGSAFYGFGLLVLIDFFTLGGFKKVKDPTFSKIYLALYRFYSTLSLSFIYRPLLLNFIDNRYTRRLFFLAFPYILVMIFGVNMMQLEKYAFIPSVTGDNKYFGYIDKYTINWNNYDDLRAEYHGTYSFMERPETKTPIFIASLNKYEIDDSYGKVFLKYLQRDNDLLKRQHPEFTPFNREGIGHSMFSKVDINDPGLDELLTTQLKETRIMLRTVRGQEESIDSLDRIDFRAQIEEYREYNEQDIPNLRKEIESKYLDQKRAFADEKIRKSLEYILSNYTVTIDDVSYTDSLDCQFYTHPNRHEKGLQCYFPMINLKPGSHLMVIKKRRSEDECTDDCPEWTKFLPFRKI